MATEAENPVIYLTGAPATGKSSVVAALTSRCPSLRRWDWGNEVRAHLSSKLGREVTYEDVRRNSGSLIEPGDVQVVDERQIEWVTATRLVAPVVIDTHAVTREAFGFRTTPFADAAWKRLGATHIFLLYASPDTVAKRLADDSAGRRSSDTFHVTLHAALQGAVATTYAILSGLPLHSICSDVMPPEEIAQLIATTSGLQAAVA